MKRGVSEVGGEMLGKMDGGVREINNNEHW